MTKTVQFTAGINRRHLRKLHKGIADATNNSEIMIKAVVTERRYSTSAFLEATGDDHQVNAFKDWVRTFALLTT